MNVVDKEVARFAATKRLGFCILDTCRRFIYTNAFAGQLLGKTREQLLGRTFGHGFSEGWKLELYAAVDALDLGQASGFQGNLQLNPDIRLALRYYPMDRCAVILLRTPEDPEQLTIGSCGKDEEDGGSVGLGRHATGPVPLEVFHELAFDRLLTSFLDMDSLAEALVRDTGRSSPTSACHLLDCPRLKALTHALREATHVLETTKGSFRSKELGELRHRLDAILEEDQD
jgi:hypothetical protein